MDKKEKHSQLELFSHSADSPQKHRQRHSIFNSCITLNLEHFIVLSVVVLMVAVFSFSLGVEKGKKINTVAVKKDVQTAVEKEEIVSAVIEPEEEVHITEEIPVDEELDLYTIQVASFKKRSSVEKEAEKLQGKGHEVLIRQKGNWVVLYVGRFNNKKEAEIVRKELEKNYGTCLIRSL